MPCLGRNLSDHCCYVLNEPCPFIERIDNQWSCQLRRETGSWDAAIADSRYHNGPGSPGFEFEKINCDNCKDYQCKECAQLENNKITQKQFEKLKFSGHRQ